ncbi:TonB family protein [Rhodoferax sp. 4810]|uniref:TonB family protein n=1 Tax=Thiospirillum jenense TaxID=1653858 RepID=A0A839HDD3_9GAMM|nr:TonB family protein [Thiospirillum jenense]MBB1073848.1 TonB family protein [Rhodoferax jenense]MBB1125197.1 TonB family protein [Thiospirillum jenense]
MPSWSLPTIGAIDELLTEQPPPRHQNRFYVQRFSAALALATAWHLALLWVFEQRWTAPAPPPKSPPPSVVMVQLLPLPPVTRQLESAPPLANQPAPPIQSSSPPPPVTAAPPPPAVSATTALLSNLTPTVDWSAAIKSPQSTAGVKSPLPPFVKGGEEDDFFVKGKESPPPFAKGEESSPPFAKLHPPLSSPPPFAKWGEEEDFFVKGGESSPPFAKGGEGGFSSGQQRGFPEQITTAGILSSQAATVAQLSQQDQSVSQTGERRVRVNAASRDPRYASYLDAWRRKVEAIGALNYPDAARHQASARSLVLQTSVRADGSLAAVRVLRSSGEAALDQAAVQIVTLAAPFAPLPDSIRARADVLDITRIWRFVPRLASD